MRYDAAQVDYLAAEYVLGTLRGPARRRFDRLITDRADVRFAVWRWERHLNGFAGGLKPCKPPRHVWHNIRSRVEQNKPVRIGFVERWRSLWLAIPAAIAAAWLAIALIQVPTVDRLAVFADDNENPVWVISANLDGGVLSAEAVNVPLPPDTQLYELWILPDAGSPLSLGLLPLDAGTFESEIPANLLAALADAGRLAVSLEPAGGSPTGLPTGPIVYQASLIEI